MALNKETNPTINFPLLQTLCNVSNSILFKYLKQYNRSNDSGLRQIFFLIQFSDLILISEKNYTKWHLGILPSTMGKSELLNFGMASGLRETKL